MQVHGLYLSLLTECVYLYMDTKLTGSPSVIKDTRFQWALGLCVRDYAMFKSVQK
jgi:hypothetical protein